MYIIIKQNIVDKRNAYMYTYVIQFCNINSTYVASTVQLSYSNMNVSRARMSHMSCIEVAWVATCTNK